MQLVSDGNGLSKEHPPLRQAATALPTTRLPDHARVTLCCALLAATGCASTAVAPAPQTVPSGWESLPPNTTLKVHTPNGYVTGKVERATADSLYLSVGGDPLSRSEVDSAWRQRTDRNDGAIAGVVAGGLAAVTLIATNDPHGEDPGLGGSLGLMVGGGLAVVGVAASALTPEWQLLFVR